MTQNRGQTAEDGGGRVGLLTLPKAVGVAFTALPLGGIVFETVLRAAFRVANNEVAGRNHLQFRNGRIRVPQDHDVLLRKPARRREQTAVR